MYIQYLNGGHPVDMKLLQSESTLSEAIAHWAVDVTAQVVAHWAVDVTAQVVPC